MAALLMRACKRDQERKRENMITQGAIRKKEEKKNKKRYSRKQEDIISAVGR